MFSGRAIRYSTTAMIMLMGMAAISHAQIGCRDNSRIVGGVDTDIKEHPWQVALISTNGILQCGGSIITDKWVLTAAHCFIQSTQTENMRAKSGVTEYRQNSGSTDIEKIVVHEKFNPVTYENDLALVKVRNQLADRIIPLAEPTLPLTQCQLLEVTGWGRLFEGGKTSQKLQKAIVPYVEISTCNEKDSYNGRIVPSMICAGFHEGGVDACQGDSGGPLVLRGPDGPVLVGVTSGGSGCARKLKFGVYTRVSDYRDWITKIVTAPTN